jgi:UDP-glucuronate decarboxylase
LVVNLACAASPPRYQADPIHTMQTNVQGVLNAATVARANNVRLVHTSTSEVYGDPECHPQTEEYRGSVNPIGPRACYDEGKRAAETVLFDCHRKFALDIGVCRIFNTYGPRMDPYDGRVVSNFLRQALQGKSITIYGDGTHTRSFCYVDDMVDALWQLCLAKGFTGPVNLGNPDEMTILELAETIRELVGARVDLTFRPIPVDDPKRRKPDISSAKSVLGWEPRTMLREGLTKTLEYFDEIISSGKIDAFALKEEHRRAANR